MSCLKSEATGSCCKPSRPATARMAQPFLARHLPAKGNEPIALEIYRDGILLRRKLCNAAKMAGGPLHLAAQRMGDRLSFMVNNLSTEFSILLLMTRD